MSMPGLWLLRHCSSHLPGMSTAGWGTVLCAKSVNRSDLFVHACFLSNASQLNHLVHIMTHKLLLWFHLEEAHALPPVQEQTT